MPLFFFLSGLTVRKETTLYTFKKSINALIVPYVCFYIFYFVKALFRDPEWLISEGWIKPLIGMLIGVGFNTDISFMVHVPLWFLIGLFCCKVLYSFVNNISGKYEKSIQIVLCIFFVLVAYLLKTNQSYLPFSIGSVFLVYPFFLLGNFLSSQLINILKYPKQLYVLVTLIIVTASVIIFTLINGRVDVANISFGSNILLFYVTGFSGIVFILIISSFIKLPNILNFFAKNTLIILALHSITTRLIEIALTKFGFAEIDTNKTIIISSVTLAIVVAIGSLLLNYIPIYIINKYFPWIIGKKNKNKTVPSNTN